MVIGSEIDMDALQRFKLVAVRDGASSTNQDHGSIVAFCEYFHPRMGGGLPGQGRLHGLQ